MIYIIISTRPTTAALLRILLFNVGYGTEIHGGLLDYATHWYRYVHTPHRVLRDVAETLQNVVERVVPDVCCLVEVPRRGEIPRSFRHFHRSLHNKYGLRSVLRWLPGFRDRCIGVFSRWPLSVQLHEFHRGMKKLVYQVSLPERISLFLTHCSLRQRARREQIEELATLVRGHSRAIVCGDFNVLHGSEELAPLLAGSDLTLVNPVGQATFPVVHPRKALDLFLCSKDLPVRSCEVLRSVRCSDHLPVLLDVDV